MKVEIYSDIACPWCYVGKRRFERALAVFPGGEDVEVTYRPYELDPTTPAEPAPLRERLAEKFGAGNLDAMNARLAEVGADAGIAFDFANALAVNTLTAHRVLRLALTEYGPTAQAALKDRLLAAYFTEGENVADHARLTEFAVEAGLDRDRVVAYLASDEGVAEVRREIDEAREMGVTAVPTFVFEGTWAVQGAEESTTFLRVLKQVRAEMRERDVSSSAAPEPAGGDACADGSCAV
ncbi:DsbA family oxidoreductase [Embleya hyalina]|uniref:DSBA oxidoreductase n=1 Tax=Embleya hyalina TaxID=516124 RepID=A0A401YS92_9ACTN|nr:DsbA family oxidoreductase [Embleya hyalina]GCD97471.1 DSBA oxidoreductase [Embleya hyalina]